MAPITPAHANVTATTTTTALVPVTPAQAGAQSLKKAPKESQSCFLLKWELQFGIQVTSKVDGEAVSVVCLFCQAFGRFNFEAGWPKPYCNTCRHFVSIGQLDGPKCHKTFGICQLTKANLA